MITSNHSKHETTLEITDARVVEGILRSPRGKLQKRFCAWCVSIGRDRVLAKLGVDWQRRLLMEPESRPEIRLARYIMRLGEMEIRQRKEQEWREAQRWAPSDVPHSDIPPIRQRTRLMEDAVQGGLMNLLGVERNELS